MKLVSVLIPPLKRDSFLSDLLRWQYNPLHNGDDYSQGNKREAPPRKNKRSIRAKSMIETKTNGEFGLRKLSKTSFCRL